MSKDTKIIKKIDVFVINLENRVDRRDSSIREFKQKEIFSVTIIHPIFSPKPAKSLWLTIQHILEERVSENDDYFILCEDDHQFTEFYDQNYLINSINLAQMLGADLLLGGVSWFKTGFQVTKNLFWVEQFTGLQFTVIFKKFYQELKSCNAFSDHEVSDIKISNLTNDKFVLYPFISTQKEFGYSDVTTKNSTKGRVEHLFFATSERFELLRKVREFYLPAFQ